jgi:tRNA(Arg) A34 adenosine deaminase TadA
MLPNPQIMELLIELAKENHRQGGFAVASAVVRNEIVIASGVTTLNQDCDPTAHAEINAIRAAAKILNSRFLDGCYLYSTYEPCPMCATAAVWAKMQGIVFGASHKDQTPECPWRILIPVTDVLRQGTPKLELYEDFMRKQCIELLHLK